MKVGVIGSGKLGSVLTAQLLRNHVFEVKNSSRFPTTESFVAELKVQEPDMEAVPAVVEWADVVILAMHMSAEEDYITAAAGLLGGGVVAKVLLDATNPCSHFPRCELRCWRHELSGAEVLQRALPATHVFKAFNTVPPDVLQAPGGSLLGSQQLSMLYAGPEDKREDAALVIAGAGFRPEYVGPIRYARNLEAIGELVMHLSRPGAGETGEDWGSWFHLQVLRQPAQALRPESLDEGSTAAPLAPRGTS